jgi:hypothetical protein
MIMTGLHSSMLRDYAAGCTEYTRHMVARARVYMGPGKPPAYLEHTGQGTRSAREQCRHARESATGVVDSPCPLIVVPSTKDQQYPPRSPPSEASAPNISVKTYPKQPQILCLRRKRRRKKTCSAGWTSL